MEHKQRNVTRTLTGNSIATHSNKFYFNKEKALTGALNSTRVLPTAGGQDGKCLVVPPYLCEE